MTVSRYQTPLPYIYISCKHLLKLEDVIIINTGDAKSEATKVGFYLSVNSKITTADLFLGEVDLPMLNPNQVADLDFQVDLSAFNVPYGD